VTMADWSRVFEEPILLKDGSSLRTLLEAGHYIAGLPKATHGRPEWQKATHFLLMAADGRLPVMFANIALLQALNAGKPPPEPRKKATKKYKVIR
jgi:hypothetical protein